MVAGHHRDHGDAALARLLDRHPGGEAGDDLAEGGPAVYYGGEGGFPADHRPGGRVEQSRLPPRVVLRQTVHTVGVVPTQVRLHQGGCHLRRILRASPHPHAGAGDERPKVFGTEDPHGGLPVWESTTGKRQD
jgi:hypothetical protein